MAGAAAVCESSTSVWAPWSTPLPLRRAARMVTTLPRSPVAARIDT